MIWITGDTHGEFTRFASKNFPEGKTLTKDDCMIVLGDFGGIWDVNESQKEEQYWIDWLTQKPWTTLFLAGNHENYDRLNALPEARKFGSVVGKVNDSIFYLKSGEIYTIDNKKLFVFGGAKSEDKDQRIEYISWWKQEEPSCTEYDKGLDNLEKNNWQVDYILTHTAPYFIVKAIAGYLFGSAPYALTKYLDQIAAKANFRQWYIGHFHFENSFCNNKFNLIYKKIIKLD